MTHISLPATLRHLVRVSNLHTEERLDMREFILNADKGEFPFTNDLGETYILSKSQGSKYTLSMPKDNFSGDPAVVDAFNKALA